MNKSITVEDINSKGLLKPEHAEAIRLKMKGLNQMEIAQALGVSQATVSRWFDRKEVQEAYKASIVKVLDTAEEKAALRYEKALDRLTDISIDSKNEDTAIRAFKELRITLGRGVQKVAHTQSSNIFEVIADFLQVNKKVQETEYEVLEQEDDQDS